MGQYADRLTNLELLLQLQKSAGRDDLSSTDVTALTAMVFSVADTVGPLLARIPRTFAQYTEHDIGHSANIIYLAGRFIPAETMERLNGLELAMLILAALLHDVGMFVEDREKDEALESREFLAFSATNDRSAALEEARRAGRHRHAERIRDALLADYFRHLHPERAGQHIRKLLAGKLVFRDLDISEHVIRLCESHAWGTLESNDPRRTDKAVAVLDTRKSFYGVPVNLQYLACCLRLADIMDFDRSRTPLAVLEAVNFTDNKSWGEWNKHLQVLGWTISEHEVQFTIDCTHPAFFVAVMEFLDWIDTELRECRQLLVKEAPKGIAERYLFHLPPIVDRFKVEMADKRYLAGAFRFQLEFDRIMQLLMDKSLYPDPSLFLRELLQNSLDACRNRVALAKLVGADKWYQPRISVWDYSDDPNEPRIIFQDNGIGMSRRILESYFMRVGRSYYKSPEFNAERQRLRDKGIELEATSQFGIGILSCFMVADRLDVETYRRGNKPLHVTIEGATKYFLVRLLEEPVPSDFPVQPDSDFADGPPAHPGTRITLYLRGDQKFDSFQVLRKLSVNVEFEIAVHSPGGTQKTIKPHRWEAKGIAIRSLPKVINLPYGATSPSGLPFQLAKNFQGVLVPVQVAFEEYHFTRNLRGSAWLWFLRGDMAKPSPNAGFLSLERSSINLTGLPALVGRIQQLKSTGFPHWKDLMTHLVTSESPFTTYLQANGDELNRYWYEFSHFELDKRWNKLAPEERTVALTCVDGPSVPSAPWYASRGVIEELCSGSATGWARRGINFTLATIALPANPQAIALHGVLLPAGFVSWDPIEVSGSKLRLLKSSGGMYIDIRGSDPPVPSASRLFIDAKEVHKVAVPVARAFFQRACELASESTTAAAWEHWLHSFLGDSLGTWVWADTANWDIENLEQILPLGGRLRNAYDQWKEMALSNR